MKKAVNWTMFAAYAVLFIDFGVMGVKLFSNHYEILVEAYIALACFLILFACCIAKLFALRCPHCGKIRVFEGNDKYCPHCGKKP